MMRSQLNSIGLAWLTRQAKDLPLPEVRFVEDSVDRSQGSYWRPKSGRVWMPHGEAVSTARGLITINVLESADVAATLAHEFRHHWQAYNQRPHRIGHFNEAGDYAGEIVKFFRSLPHEADALRFELQVAPHALSREWASWLGWPTRRRSFNPGGSRIR